jgi:peptidoglycan/LPS O-acetylase OafA/YrhL
MFLKQSLEVERKTSSGMYLDTLTGVRAVAVLWTLILHMWGITHGGDLLIPNPFGRDLNMRLFAQSGEWGVRIFFVLSGFLLSLPYLRQTTTIPLWQKALNFYERRALRILPAYYALLLVMLYLCLFGYDKLPSPSYMLGHVLFINHWWMEAPIRGIFWTLPVEVSFYLVLPVLILALNPRHWLLLLLGTVTLVFCFKVAIRYYAQAGHPDLWPLGISFLAQMEYFVAGMLAAHFFVQRRPSGKNGDRWMLLAVILVVLQLQLFGRHVERVLAWYPHSHYTFSFFSAVTLAMFTYGAAAAGPAARMLLGNRGMVFIGTISFSLYLWHTVFMDAFDHARLLQGIPTDIKFSVACLYMLPPIFIASMASYWFIELPFLRIRHDTGQQSGNWITRRPVAALALAGVMLVVLTWIANLAFAVNHPVK